MPSRKKKKIITNLHIKMIRRLMNSAILNPMFICSTSLPGMNTDHIKFRVDLVHVFLVEYASHIKRKVSGRHSVAKTAAQTTERLFAQKILPTSHGQQRGVLCAINKTRGGIQHYGPSLWDWSLHRGMLQDITYKAQLKQNLLTSTACSVDWVISPSCTDIHQLLGMLC